MLRCVVLCCVVLSCPALSPNAVENLVGLRTRFRVRVRMNPWLGARLVVSS